MRRPGRSDVRTGRLRAADPFELIRWLARSQTDPRKALAELVQNSLDAQARTVTITRVRERGLATLRVLDDGEGVIPELARPEALAYVATHIGHSRKRNLTPEQRRELLLQGQYGIGLLGFWSIGAELEVRSQVAGGDPWVLRMWEEKPSHVRVGCGGTVVYDDLTAALDGRFAVEPWTAGRIAGILDFPDFAVAPGSRRGVLLDEAAEAFARAVDGELGPAVYALLAEDERRRVAAVEADLVHKLERAFRDLPREAPEHDFLAVRGSPGTRGPAAPSGEAVA